MLSTTMTMATMINLEQIMTTVQLLLQNQSPAHDFQHMLRVYKNAEMISKQEESVDLDIVLAAALLHDLVVYPKGSSKTINSADDSAEIAKKILLEYKNYPREKIEKVADAIRTHSYSKRLVPQTLEGKILQDADRLDAIGAIGIARTFSVGGSENRSLYNPTDAFCETERQLDDTQWTLDHIKRKLMILKNSMHTKTAKKIAEERTEFMELFLNQLRKEILPKY
ncbi:MAG: HD domain-containing protein [Nitrososphaeraceae archaeon]|nr:HD domain-containing protein [Nitrososphaeraceae archaeon]